MSTHDIERTVYPVLREIQTNPKTKRVSKYLRDHIGKTRTQIVEAANNDTCLLYTSDAADDTASV